MPNPKRQPWTIIVPPLAQTAATGFIGAVEQTCRGNVLRVELWRHGQAVRLTRDSKPVAWDKAAHVHRKLAHDYAAWLKAGQELGAAASGLTGQPSSQII